jgi:hypothetical protein
VEEGRERDTHKQQIPPKKGKEEKLVFTSDAPFGFSLVRLDPVEYSFKKIFLHGWLADARCCWCGLGFVRRSVECRNSR